MTSSIQVRLAMKLLEKEMIIPFPVDNDISPLFVIKSFLNTKASKS
jgi:hypothetical protein